jgi:hypothetical protein
MKRTISAITGLVGIVFLVSGAEAVPLVINFDTDPSSNPIAHGTEISTTYASQGVTFEVTMPDDGGCGTGVYANSDCLNPEGTTSPPNVVTLCDGNTCSDISENAHGLVRALFSSPAIDVCIDFIPVDPDDNGVIRAYDANHVLLDEAVSAVGVTGQICVSGVGIASVEFSGFGSNFGWFDNLSIEFDSVPTAPVTFSAIKSLYR